MAIANLRGVVLVVSFYLGQGGDCAMGLPGKTRGKSGQWAARQQRDPYVKQARQLGFRSRAAFKLAQIDRQYRLLKADSIIVDLGSAPGGWSQYAANQVHAANQVVAVDCLVMQVIDKVQFIHGDFTQTAVTAQIAAALARHGGRADVVLSDMAPNISGIRSADQARAAELQHAIVQFCRHSLKPDGQLLSKLFVGETTADLRAQLSAEFAQVRTVKPPASRPQSKEIYLLARGYHGAA